MYNPGQNKILEPFLKAGFKATIYFIHKCEEIMIHSPGKGFPVIRSYVHEIFITVVHSEQIDNCRGGCRIKISMLGRCHNPVMPDTAADFP